MQQCSVSRMTKGKRKVKEGETLKRPKITIENCQQSEASKTKEAPTEFPDPVSYEHITSVVEEWVREEISSNEASMCDWSKVVLPTLSFEKKLEDASEALGGVFDDIEVFKGLEDRGF
ncbi:hypothetical protein R6Q59_026674 [Mikania micrantha]